MEQAKAKWDKSERAREVGQLQRDLPDQLRRKEKADAKAREEGKPISRKDKHILKLQAKRFQRSIHTAGHLWRYPNCTVPVVDWVLSLMLMAMMFIIEMSSPLVD